MDTSPEYIKMCEKAGEIQSLWKPDIIFGSVLWLIFSKEVMVDTQCNSTSGAIWLPRQDQLQNMVDEPLSDFNYYSGDPNYKKHLALLPPLIAFASKYGKVTSSMEQLWLAFVMKERFHKVWSGTDWTPSK